MTIGWTYIFYLAGYMKLLSIPWMVSVRLTLIIKKCIKTQVSNADFLIKNDDFFIFRVVSLNWQFSVSSPVQFVKIISLPDSSVLISWKWPKHFHKGLYRFVVFCFRHSNEPYTKEENVFFYNENYCGISVSRQIKIFNRSSEVMFSYIIIPSALQGQGFEWVYYLH